MKLSVTVLALAVGFSAYGFELQCETDFNRKVERIAFTKTTSRTATFSYEQHNRIPGSFLTALLRQLQVPSNEFDRYQIELVDEMVVQNETSSKEHNQVGFLAIAKLNGANARLKHTYMVKLPNDQGFEPKTDVYPFTAKSVFLETVYTKSIDKVGTQESLQLHVTLTPDPFTTVKQIFFFSPNNCQSGP